MKKLLQYLFGTSIESLKQKSVAAISVFKETVTKLEQANDKAKSEILAREKEMDRLAQENITLGEIVVGNNKFIKKINEFLN